jgi:hypothetical protein
MAGPSKRTLQEYLTTLAPDEVLVRATTFFATRPSLYAAFLDENGPGYRTFRGQGGEEVVIAATAMAGGSRVTGSTYLFDMQLARFFTTLPAAGQASASAAALPVESPASPPAP